MSLSTRSGKDEEKAACDIQKGENDVSKTSPVQSEQNGSVGDQPTTKPNRDVPSNSSDKETDQPSRGSKEGVGSTKPEKASNFISDFGRKCRGDPAYLDNLRHSLYLALALFALGVIESQSGPTFLDLQIITGTNVGQASAFFTAHSCGYLLGSTTSGYVSGRKINASLTLMLSMLSMGAASIILPYCSIFAAMVVMRGFTGVFGGFIDTTANAEHMRIWGRDGPVLMQLLHFCFALGGVVSPLVTEPFLAEREHEKAPGRNQNISHHRGSNSVEIHLHHEPINVSNYDEHLNVSNFSSDPVEHIGFSLLNLSSSTHQSNTNESHLELSESRETNVHWAFLITGIIVILTSTPFIFLYKKSRREEKKLETDEKEEDVETPNKSHLRKIPLGAHLVAIAGLGAFYVLYCSVEDTFASFLMTFLVRQFKSVSKSDGAHITAVYWSSFAASRFLMIFVSRVLSPVRVLYVGGSLMLLSFTGFTLSSGPWMGGGPSDMNISDVTPHLAGEDGGSVPAVTFFAAMAGLAMSGVFPAGLSWSGAELIQVTGRISSCVFVSASLGAMLNPLVVSRLMQDVSNMWFCYLILLEVSGLALVFCSLLAFNRCFLNPRYGKMHSPGLDVEVTGQGDIDEAEHHFL